ncbi:MULTISPECIES: endonuclease/exonuclease/phosphatase family protein [unclassified Nocardioides]|uniref:endonuclease/exonuclease/phosphatase family protein n=1 Tax=unclassified Nocardioides TaxID=2615069 RepID=UPI00361DF743
MPLPRLARPLLTILVTVAVAGGLLAAPTAAVTEPAAQRSDRTHFRIASFNVLAGVHTDGPSARRGFDRSGVRIHRVVKILNRSSIDVVGFQELNKRQLRPFRKSTDRWRVFTGKRGVSENSIAWRRDQFEFVKGWTVPVPYFHGRRQPMPVVKLRSKQAHRAIYVMNTHHPADTRGSARHWRAEATRIEQRVTTRLSRRHHAPVFLTGDMNDREAFLCPFTRNGVMHSTYGRSHRDGRCGVPNRAPVDWILGNRQVRFSHARVDRSPLVNRTTDHPVVSARVRLR